MDNSNFIVTGTGRCGTKFLSNLLNRSKLWTVLHEPRGWKHQFDGYNNAHHVFTNHNFYGEVSRSLIMDLLKFKWCRKAVIIRPYKEVVLSYSNRRYNMNTMISAVCDVNREYNQAISLSQRRDVLTIDFHKMVSNSDYLNNILVALGVEDIKATKFDMLAKVNENKEIAFKRYIDLPKVIQDCVSELNWNK